MSKSFRVSVVCASLILALSQVALAGVVTQSKEQAANAETSKNSASLKSAKKKKKSKTVASTVVVLGVYAQPTVFQLPSVTPAAISTVSSVPVVTPATRDRGTVSARKITGISISPNDPPASVAVAGQFACNLLRFHIQ